MQNQRIDIGSIRRKQIVSAAAAIIAEQGLQNLSLSEIEAKAGMSRGQLTYYFPAKEDILLAVFDHLVEMMCQRVGPEREAVAQGGWWQVVQFLLKKLLTEPPVSPQFGPLQYTFLSQMSHRDDFRARLAGLYEQWRSRMTGEIKVELSRRPARHRVPPRALATFVQAIIHGLLMQRAADPDVFDGERMVALVLDILSVYLWHRPHTRPRRRTAGVSRPVTARRNHRPVSTGRSPGTGRRLAAKGINGERVAKSRIATGNGRR